jgi:hypothetical protein
MSVPVSCSSQRHSTKDNVRIAAAGVGVYPLLRWSRTLSSSLGHRTLWRLRAPVPLTPGCASLLDASRERLLLLGLTYQRCSGQEGWHLSHIWDIV